MNQPLIDSDDGMADAKHKPDREEDGWCVCGAQEVYFEDWGVTGYGCDVAGPYRDLLNRRGFHIHPQSTVDHLSDEEHDQLMDDPRWDRIEKLTRW